MTDSDRVWREVVRHSGETLQQIRGIRISGAPYPSCGSTPHTHMASFHQSFASVPTDTNRRV